jgi:hypothetical protein
VIFLLISDISYQIIINRSFQAEIAESEKGDLADAVRLVLSLGIYLSLENVQPASSQQTRIGLSKLDRGVHYDLKVLIAPPSLCKTGLYTLFAPTFAAW